MFESAVGELAEPTDMLFNINIQFVRNPSQPLGRKRSPVPPISDEDLARLDKIVAEIPTVQVDEG
jgi:hypothetical protein